MRIENRVVAVRKLIDINNLITPSCSALLIHNAITYILNDHSNIFLLLQSIEYRKVQYIKRSIEHRKCCCVNLLRQQLLARQQQQAMQTIYVCALCDRHGSARQGYAIATRACIHRPPCSHPHAPPQAPASIGFRLASVVCQRTPMAYYIYIKVFELAPPLLDAERKPIDV